MAWLINSMDDRISESFMCYSTAKQMWEAAKRQYSDLDNSSQLFELRNKARNLTQGEKNVTTYFNALTKLCQEVDLFHNGHWFCAGCVENYQKMVNKERIYDFLSALNKDHLMKYVEGYLVLNHCRVLRTSLLKPKGKKPENVSCWELKRMWLKILPSQSDVLNTLEEKTKAKRRMETCGVITVRNQTTVGTGAGNCMESLTIGKTKRIPRASKSLLKMHHRLETTSFNYYVSREQLEKLPRASKLSIIQPKSVQHSRSPNTINPEYFLFGSKRYFSDYFEWYI